MNGPVSIILGRRGHEGYELGREDDTAGLAAESEQSWSQGIILFSKSGGVAVARLFSLQL